MVIFHSYVKWPEGTSSLLSSHFDTVPDSNHAVSSLIVYKMDFQFVIAHRKDPQGLTLDGPGIVALFLRPLTGHTWDRSISL